MFKKTLVSGFVVAALGGGLAQAQTPAAPAAPASPHTLTGNVGIFSQYIFRGLTQTDRSPALQGGFDYAHSSGLYVGTWASNISWLNDSNAYTRNGSLEWDFYGGFKGSFAGDFTYDAGLLYYYYPGTAAAGFIKANTLEGYGSVGWKWITAKVSYSLDNKTFGVTDSRGTYYAELNADVPIGETGLTANLHFGRQKYTGNGGANHRLYTYNDWKIGVTYALPKDFSIGAFYSDTGAASPAGYGSVAEGGAYPRNIAKSTGTVFIKKTF